MSDEPETAAPRTASDLGEPGEHPISVLLFSWMRTEVFDRAFLAVLGGGCALLAALELVVRRHDGPSVDGLPVFYGVYGFLAFSIAVLSGWPLARLLRRREGYYGEPDGSGEPGGSDESGGKPDGGKEAEDEDRVTEGGRR